MEKLRALPKEERDKLLASVLKQASRGIGFWYQKRSLKPLEPGVLGDLADWLNSATTLDFFARITGESRYYRCSIQATRFNRGDFLTRHQDVVTEEQRKAAFVINLSQEWHPDWGGLLQFFQPDGTSRDAWSPEFNTLSLFDVSHVHSVTCVSPFARMPRLAISGWLHTV